MRQMEPYNRVDRFGQGLTGIMGGTGGVQTQTSTGGAVSNPLGSAINTGVGAFSLGKLFGL